MNDESYSLYAVDQPPTVTNVINGNSALAQRQWDKAENDYQAELKQNSQSTLALLGLAEIAHAKGHFANAIALLNQAVAESNQPAFHYRLGQIYGELVNWSRACSNIPKPNREAHRMLPGLMSRWAMLVSRLGAIVARLNSLRPPSTMPIFMMKARQIALADMWRQRGQMTRALTLYEQAVSTSRASTTS